MTICHRSVTSDAASEKKEPEPQRGDQRERRLGQPEPPAFHRQGIEQAERPGLALAGERRRGNGETVEASPEESRHGHPPLPGLDVAHSARRATARPGPTVTRSTQIGQNCRASFHHNRATMEISPPRTPTGSGTGRRQATFAAGEGGGAWGRRPRM